MHWLTDYWWIVLLLLAGVIINAIKELSRLNPKKFLDNKPKLPPHRDLNASWDDEDDWPQANGKKSDHQKDDQKK
ncbi:YpfN family protein [Xenorhabdus sp. PB61.4]|uniref:YpfN family protein n=1 Tax=Xenorhabdus TaxID=626 RepID=UPI001E4C402D|nr:YpfN family protein [Xenorhabdus sp. PB61.4]MCC8367478.1 YpfN family protein [Xenorhabdus sp. PB61.4]